MRILIAEDDQVLADGLLRALRATGYAVDQVGSGSEADANLVHRVAGGPQGAQQSVGQHLVIFGDQNSHLGSPAGRCCRKQHLRSAILASPADTELEKDQA